MTPRSSSTSHNSLLVPLNSVWKKEKKKGMRPRRYRNNRIYGSRGNKRRRYWEVIFQEVIIITPDRGKRALHRERNCLKEGHIYINKVKMQIKKITSAAFFTVA